EARPRPRPKARRSPRRKGPARALPGHPRNGGPDPPRSKRGLLPPLGQRPHGHNRRPLGHRPRRRHPQTPRPARQRRLQRLLDLAPGPRTRTQLPPPLRPRRLTLPPKQPHPRAIHVPSPHHPPPPPPPHLPPPPP